MVVNNRSNLVMEVVNDAEELAEAGKRREQFDRNCQWLQQHVSEVYRQHRGQFICIAGGELFVADTVEDAVGQALAAHPNDQGWFTRYIPKQKVARIYAV